jgi:transketolase C-terminal domain/subunit
MAPITFVLAGLAVTYLWLGVIMLASRREGVITIEEHRIVFRGVATPREQVAVVRYDYDATFKGTRIELVDGSFVRLAAGTHRHRKVLAAFRRNNYPVT